MSMIRNTSLDSRDRLIPNSFLFADHVVVLLLASLIFFNLPPFPPL